MQWWLFRLQPLIDTLNGSRIGQAHPQVAVEIEEKGGAGFDQVSGCIVQSNLVRRC
jgi:hypothetical protein